MKHRRRVRKVLVANRGEIAVRILRTLKTLGLRSVQVFSDADRDSLPVELADECARLGPAPAAESYLNVDRILDAARRHTADAIHPGYGFLSERETFARRVEEAGLVFLGPTPQNIQQLGDKLEARLVMERLGLSPVPGSNQPMRGPEEAQAFAARHGFPILLKAAAGGGGMGIRIVRRSEDLDSAFRLAAAEAQSSFGSSLLFVERYLERARHVEVQVLGDGKGGVRLFHERDCSIQRRLQKLMEETPSPAVTEEIRDRLLAAAHRLVKETHYRSAGTLEFLLSEEGSLHFLEMNTRIQVEHPVTEATTGMDLVAEQLAVAEGARFTANDLDGATVAPRGAAIELRVYAEDPWRDFLPAAGTIHALHFPSAPGLRVDTALQPGTEVTPFYDPLLAKIVAWGQDRSRALSRLRHVLGEFTIGGVATTLPVGTALLEDRSFQRGDYHCQYLQERLASRSYLRARPRANEIPAIVAAMALLRHEAQQATTRLRPAAPTSAWRLVARAGRLPRRPRR